jgi:enamine deaminase RidA (YjgF/YER057c/UK114 family)
VTVVNPAGVRKVAGYNHAKVRRGTPVFLTGQVAWDVDGNVVGPGDIEAQLDQAWGNVRAVLAGLGLEMDDIVKLTTYITDARHMPAVGAAKARQFTSAAMPASTLLIVAGLADPALLVEIEATVMIG